MKFPREKNQCWMMESIWMVYCFMFSVEYLSAYIHLINVCAEGKFIPFEKFCRILIGFLCVRVNFQVSLEIWRYLHSPLKLFTLKFSWQEIKLEFIKSSAPWHIKNHFNSRNIKRNCQFKDCSWDLLAINYELR